MISFTLSTSDLPLIVGVIYIIILIYCYISFWWCRTPKHKPHPGYTVAFSKALSHSCSMCIKYSICLDRIMGNDQYNHCWEIDASKLLPESLALLEQYEEASNEPGPSLSAIFPHRSFSNRFPQAACSDLPQNFPARTVNIPDEFVKALERYSKHKSSGPKSQKLRAIKYKPPRQ